MFWDSAMKSEVSPSVREPSSWLPSIFLSPLALQSSVSSFSLLSFSSTDLFSCLPRAFLLVVRLLLTVSPWFYWLAALPAVAPPWRRECGPVLPTWLSPSSSIMLERLFIGLLVAEYVLSLLDPLFCYWAWRIWLRACSWAAYLSAFFSVRWACNASLRLFESFCGVVSKLRVKTFFASIRFWCWIMSCSDFVSLKSFWDSSRWWAAVPSSSE